jgi:hypothetical protein
MSCKISTEGRQTEFEFYQQMMNTPDGTHCCGPKLAIGLTRDSMKSFLDFLVQHKLTIGTEYLDKFDPVVIDSQHLSLTMCARHWFQHADLLGNAGEVYDTDAWDHLSFFIFRVTCIMNSWDTKEITNYLG